MRVKGMIACAVMIFQSHCAVIAAKLGYVVNSQPFGDRIISLTVTDCHTYLYACMTLYVGDHIYTGESSRVHNNNASN